MINGFQWSSIFANALAPRKTKHIPSFFQNNGMNKLAKKFLSYESNRLPPNPRKM